MPIMIRSFHSVLNSSVTQPKRDTLQRAAPSHCHFLHFPLRREDFCPHCLLTSVAPFRLLCFAPLIPAEDGKARTITSLRRATVVPAHRDGSNIYAAISSAGLRVMTKGGYPERPYMIVRIALNVHEWMKNVQKDVASRNTHTEVASSI
jgi:hypothetical protein